MGISTSMARNLMVAAVLGFASPLALAAGSGSSNNNDNNDNNGNHIPSAAELHCTEGQVVKYKTKNGKKVYHCAEAQQDGSLSDDELYRQGVQLAKSGHYDWALDVLARIKDQNKPEVLNYMGYSHRKAGRLEKGISYYAKALAINPDFVLAREYLGEGYVAAGRIDLAMVQLDEIKTRCGVSCEQYVDLKKAIDTGIN